MAEYHQAHAELIIERNATRNFVLNVLDGGFFYLGLSLISRYTVLPLLVERLTGERWMQGLIPMLAQTGWFLPGLFLAPLVASLPRRKPMVLLATLGERLPILGIGLLLFFMPQLPALTLLSIFFVLFGIHAFSSGFASIPWQDFIARIIPGNRWGIFFGVQSGLGGLLGFGGALVAAWALTQWPFPQSVGVLALMCFAAMVVSFVCLASTVEPAMQPVPRQSISSFLQGVWPLLQRDRRFRSFLIARAGIALGLLGHNFLTASALERFGLKDSDVAPFTAALFAAQAVADLILGWLADRWGHKQVLEISTVMGVLALILAVIAPTPLWFILIFVLVGATQAGYQLSGFTLVMGFSEPAERPTYIGVANTAMAPVTIAGPLLAGGLAELAGYNTLFVVLIAVAIAGLAMLHWQVRHVKDEQVKPAG